MRSRNWLFYPSSALAQPDFLWLRGDDPNGDASPPAGGTPQTSAHDFSSFLPNTDVESITGEPVYTGDGWDFGATEVTAKNFAREHPDGFDISHYFVVCTLNKRILGDALIDTGTPGSLTRYQLSMNSVSLDLNRDGVGGGIISIPQSAYSTGVTYLVTAIFAGSSSVLRLNAGAVASVTGTLSSALTAAAGVNPMHIGSNTANNNYYFGVVKEVRVFTPAAALTPTQVTAIETDLMTRHGL